jgi:hypothetical protein
MDKLSEFRCSGYNIILVGGKNALLKPLAIAKLLKVEVLSSVMLIQINVVEDEINKHKKQC